ncbi:MAG: hypothetical protein ACYS9T_01260 [Planctomycetota bacterium]|jgi:hypothetical protein
MGKRKARKARPKVRGKLVKKTRADRVKEIEAEQLAKRERYFEILAIAALFGFGLYQSVLYFGHTIVPNSDFPAFLATGQELLSFQTPSSFKRVPVLGLSQVLLSYVVGGQHPGLTAGWLLNAILHPFNLILLWLVGREIVGKSALWVAIIAILNPQVLYLLTEPIAETTFLFFILLTFYSVFRRSKWSYLLASITSMVRYEGAVLILVVFVMDVIHHKSRRERIRAFLYSALASIPLLFWMLGTVLSWRSAEASHYLRMFSKDYAEGFAKDIKERTGLVKHMELLWRTGFHNLLSPYHVISANSFELFLKLTKAFAIVSFFFASIYGLCKRNWKVLALLLFFVPYFLVHARYPHPILRFHATIFWIALLLCWFGLQSCWRLIDKNGRVPKGLVLVLQALVVIVAVAWIARLFPYLPKESSRWSPRSASVPYVAMTLVAVIFAARVLVHKFRCFLRELAILLFTCLIIVSNQFVLVRTVSDGQKNKEFRLLADWYIDNAEPGEKLAVYMTAIVRLFAPKYAEYIVGFPKADSPTDLVKTLYDNDVTYVVWATREGLRGPHAGYLRLGLDKNIALLREPKDTGPYEFVRQVGWERGWVNIFRLRKPAEMSRHELPSH